MRPFFVVNPAGGGGEGSFVWPWVCARLDSLGLLYEAQFTSSPSDAMDLTRRALREGKSPVVAMGGDGTIGQVVNGFFEDGELIYPDAVLGIIPVGSGNDLARFLGLPKGESAVPWLLRPPRRADIGIAIYRCGNRTQDSRYFLNVAATGLPVDVVRRFSKQNRGKSGFLAYLAASLGSLSSAFPVDVNLSIDEGEPVLLPALALVIANGRYFGGGMMVNPTGRIDDGLFEAIALKKTSTLRLLYGLFRLYLGAHLSMPEIAFHRARQIRLQSDTPFELMLDGDQVSLSVSVLDVAVLPQSLPVLF